MTDKIQELTNRYIYEVTRRVPRAQQSEIEMELQELIADMAEGMSIEQVFEKLGDPALFAQKYREDRNYVISPEYYDNYIWVMKIALICTWGGLFVAMLVDCIAMNQDIISEMSGFVSNLISSSLMAFGTITLIFAIMERLKIKVDIKQDKAWTVDMLSPIPEKKARISRGDCIVSLVFIILFSCFMIFMPNRLGIYYTNGSEELATTFFNMEKWNIILPLFLLSMGISFIDELVHLIIGCYCKIVMVSSIIANIAQIVLGVILLKVIPFWNEHFIESLKKLADTEFGYKNQVAQYCDAAYFSNIILLIIIVASCFEVGVVIYKTLRYGRR